MSASRSRRLSGESVLIAALDRSRKRHLSPSTLRGDLAVDRLPLQEESASPVFKKNKATARSEAMALSAEEFRDFRKLQCQ